MQKTCLTDEAEGGHVNLVQAGTVVEVTVQINTPDPW